MKKNIRKVSIKFRPGAYGMFRNLQNKVWYALGEYVDNAVQSFLDNREKLERLQNGKYQFEIKISVDRENDIIKISDNAAGISEDKFEGAFEPANVPTDNTGLHEFGMGMKTASIWLSDLWSVRTVALGEGVERFMEFNLEKVQAEEREELDAIETPANKSTHFTEIVLHKLSKNAPTSYQMDKIKKHLSSIYRKFIRSGDLKLIIDNEEMTHEEPEILNAPIYSKSNTKPIEWKKEIDFSYGRYRAKGFIAILNTMSTNEVNGLSLFRRGRVVEGSHDEKYRPKVICGNVGSPRYKRIFGELELEGFAVSFNKGSFQEQDDLQSLMDALRIEISSNKFNLYDQAEKYLKPKGAQESAKVAKNIVNSLKKEVKNGDLKDKIEASLKEINGRNSLTLKSSTSRSAKAIESHEDVIDLGGEEYRLKLEFVTESKMSDLYVLLIDESGDSNKVTYKINLAHPFFARYEQFKTKDSCTPIVRIIRSLVLAELLAPSQGTKSPGNIRMNFNSFLKNF